MRLARALSAASPFSFRKYAVRIYEAFESRKESSPTGRRHLAGVMTSRPRESADAAPQGHVARTVAIALSLHAPGSSWSR